VQDKIYLRFDHAHIAPADFAALYTPAQLRQDFLYATAMIEHVHPDFATMSGKDYAQKKAAILAQLDHPMTRLDFDKVVEQINPEYHDGHTNIWVPIDEWDVYIAQNPVVPLNVRIDADRTTILSGLGKLQIPAGSQLLSVNGQDGTALGQAMAGRVSGETEPYRRAYAGTEFALFSWIMGVRPPFQIVYRAPGAAQATSITADGIKFDDWTTATGGGGEDPYHLAIQDGVALLAMKDFDSTLYDQVEAFLKDSFQKIRDSKVKAVVLDFRQCKGGDTGLTDELQTYLSNDDLPALESVTVKATPEVKAMYRTLMPPGFRWIPINSLVPILKGIQDAPDDGFYTFHPEGLAPTKRKSPNALAFTGDLYVLVDANTYSTCLIAAAPYKYWKRAEFIGEPPGEGLTFFGDDYKFDMPNTKLQTTVSHKMFKLYGSQGFDVQLQPDILVAASGPDAYAIALQEIARKASSHP
jgi:hypothetical protein